MSEKQPHQRPNLTENYRPDTLKKNYVPTTPKPPQPAGHGVQGNYVPTTGSSEPKTPPPMPKKK